MSTPDVTGLLRELSNGNATALENLFPIIYEEIRQVAHRQLNNERDDHTINTTALVHEVYLKLAGNPPRVDWQNRAHFFSVAARAMRQILINYAKARRRLKRGGSTPDLSLDEALVVSDERADALIALDEALDRLGKLNERQVQIVECRYFIGLSVDETSEALGVSRATVHRDWTTARLWLHREVKEMLR